MWCSCTVLSLDNVPKSFNKDNVPKSFYKPGEAVWVRWDANNRVEPPELETDGALEIKPSLWNGTKEGAWRLDLDHMGF